MTIFTCYLPYFAAMIAFLKGQFVQKTPASVIVDVNGVGYEVQISLNTYSSIQALTGGQLYTHLHIREDAQILYGFSDLKEKELFTQLIAVNGIGAGTARVMLSSMKPDEISRAIVQGNVKQLESIKGIGRKTAERVVLELRDKLSKQVNETNIASLVNNSLEQDALNALLALGIGRNAAELAVKKVIDASPAGEKIEDIIKKALKIL
ncbi:MAG TPA: Holliday junction branch migration protein RuvA [Chitinophagaceae bacterium]|nr:Holliday junction branch migration protein RuvA [Chitinophagaceae bacterium]